MRLRVFVSAFSLLAGCMSPEPNGPHEIIAADLIADPAAFEGAPVFVDGPVEWIANRNAAACEHTPCNNAWGPYVLGDASTFHSGGSLLLVAGEDWPYPERTAGMPVQSCYEEPCEGGQPLGCNGNDVEVHCAPAVPARIVGVYGRVIPNPTSGGAGFVFEVESFELADGPTEQDWGGIRMTE